MHEPYHLYILLCNDGTYYIGSTRNVDARVMRHNEGRASNYTAIRRPLTLAYTEAYPDQSAAMRREQQLKGWSHQKRQALVDGDLERLKQLSKRRS